VRPRQSRGTAGSDVLEGSRGWPAEGDRVWDDPREVRGLGKELGEWRGPGFHRGRTAGNLRRGRAHQLGTDGGALTGSFVGIVGG